MLQKKAKQLKLLQYCHTEGCMPAPRKFNVELEQLWINYPGCAFVTVEF